MTVDKFISEIEITYGLYNPVIKKQVFRYFEKYYYYPSELKKLLECTMLSFSSTIGKVPDAAVFEKIDKENRIKKWGPGGDRIIPAEDRKPMITENHHTEDDIPTDWKKIVEDLVKENRKKMKHIRQEKQEGEM